MIMHRGIESDHRGGLRSCSRIVLIVRDNWITHCSLSRLSRNLPRRTHVGDAADGRGPGRRGVPEASRLQARADAHRRARGGRVRHGDGVRRRDQRPRRDGVRARPRAGRAHQRAPRQPQVFDGDRAADVPARDGRRRGRARGRAARHPRAARADDARLLARESRADRAGRRAVQHLEGPVPQEEPAALGGDARRARRRRARGAHAARVPERPVVRERDRAAPPDRGRRRRAEAVPRGAHPARALERLLPRVREPGQEKRARSRNTRVRARSSAPRALSRARRT